MAVSDPEAVSDDELMLTGVSRPGWAGLTEQVWPRGDPSADRETAVHLTTSDAARLLGVEPSLLRSWDRRYGFPSSRPGGRERRRQFVFNELVALREALESGLSVTAAVHEARRIVAEQNAAALFAAWLALDHARCERAWNDALAARPFETAVEKVLVPALDLLADACGANTLPWAFAVEIATDWLQASIPATPAPNWTSTVLIADASNDPLDRDAIYIHVLELLCRSTACNVLSVPISDLATISNPTWTDGPEIIVIAGSGHNNRIVSAWTTLAHQHLTDAKRMVFRCEARLSGTRGATTGVLPTHPARARDQLQRLLDGQVGE